MATAYKIEKNIPVTSHGRTEYPFDEMEVGDSFAIPLTGEGRPVGVKHTADKAATRLRNAANHNVKRRGDGRKFTTRVLPEEGIVRCWRVA